MKFGSLVAGLAFIIDPAAIAQAAEIKVLGAAFLRPVVDELGPQFEQSTGHKVAIKWVPGPAIGREADPGERFDVAMSQATTIDDMIKTGKLDHTSRAELARAGLAVAVHAGAPKPDVTSVEGFKRALLSAKSIAISPESEWSLFGGAARSLRDCLGSKAQDHIAAGQHGRRIRYGCAWVGRNRSCGRRCRSGHGVGRFPRGATTVSGVRRGYRHFDKGTRGRQGATQIFASEAAAPVIKAKGMEPPHPN